MFKPVTQFKVKKTGNAPIILENNNNNNIIIIIKGKMGNRWKRKRKNTKSKSQIRHSNLHRLIQPNNQQDRFIVGPKCAIPEATFGSVFCSQYCP